MKVLICLSALLALGSCGPLKTYINQGAVAGPLHPATGPLVATKRGWKDINLEGFSEDDNADGFVDPIGQTVYAAPAPVVYAQHAPAVYTPTVVAHPQPVVKTVVAAKPVEVPQPTVKIETTPLVKTVPAATPVLTYGHALQPVQYTHHLPAVTTHHKTVTHHVPITKTYTTTQHVGTHVTSYVNHPGVLGVHPAQLPVVGVASAAAVVPAKADEGVTEA